MKILMVNKFLHPCGGAETYIFKLGEYLISKGHEVQYFGMDHQDRVVGNDLNCYTKHIEFHTNKLEKLLYPAKIIFSLEAKHKMKALLENFKPDVIHLNNFNYQLTPSIIYAVQEYNKKMNCKVPIIFTAHDYQLVCPNHMMRNIFLHTNCEKCATGKYFYCIKNRCIHGSIIKSILGSVEGYLYNKIKTYKYIDKVICPSYFMEKKISLNPLLKGKTVVLHNFIGNMEQEELKKDDYVLYFGRLSEEKGIRTLIEVCKKLKNIKFVFAGNGPLETQIKKITNINYVGFQSGNALKKLIKEARMSVYPSEWYENCPFSIMESQMYGTPVIGANIGGIPELIVVGKTGELFESGNVEELSKIIENIWKDKEKCIRYSSNCKNIEFDTIDEYGKKLLKIYSN